METLNGFITGIEVFYAIMALSVITAMGGGGGGGGGAGGEEPFQFSKINMESGVSLSLTRTEGPSLWT